jgi:hypothetical protein
MGVFIAVRLPMIQLRISCELTLFEAYGSGYQVGYSLSAKLKEIHPHIEIAASDQYSRRKVSDGNSPKRKQ